MAGQYHQSYPEFARKARLWTGTGPWKSALLPGNPFSMMFLCLSPACIVDIYVFIVLGVQDPGVMRYFHHAGMGFVDLGVYQHTTVLTLTTVLTDLY